MKRKLERQARFIQELPYDGISTHGSLKVLRTDLRAVLGFHLDVGSSIFILVLVVITFPSELV